MSHRNHTLGLLNRCQEIYETLPFPTQDFEEEGEIYSTQIEFLKSTPDCFKSDYPSGHFTASTLIVDKSLNRVLLTHHKKLNMWLQLGGHADGNSMIHETAMREAQEESGLSELSFINVPPLTDSEDESLPLPFDLDYHQIPRRGDTPPHIHYDVRFLMIAHDPEKIICSDESHDLRWFDLDEAKDITDERSMHRQFHKLEILKQTGFIGLS